jgi:hypothetical protein
MVVPLARGVRVTWVVGVLQVVTLTAKAQMLDNSSSNSYSADEFMAAFSKAMLYILSATSGFLLLASLGAACELPYPVFCCYNVPYSDRAACGRKYYIMKFGFIHLSLVIPNTWMTSDRPCRSTLLPMSQHPTSKPDDDVCMEHSTSRVFSCRAKNADRHRYGSVHRCTPASVRPRALPAEKAGSIGSGEA